MKCEHNQCDIDLSFLIVQIKSNNQEILRCPNHILMDLEVVVAQLRNKKPFNQKCGCCDSEETFIINYGGDGEIALCLEDLVAFLELRLEPIKFKRLFAEYPEHYMLHDDYYDSSTGEALQPRIIISTK